MQHNERQIEADMVPFGFYDDGSGNITDEEHVWDEFDRAMRA
jgi:hypothetical protein